MDNTLQFLKDFIELCEKNPDKAPQSFDLGIKWYNPIKKTIKQSQTNPVVEKTSEEVISKKTPPGPSLRIKRLWDLSKDDDKEFNPMMD